MEAVDRKVVAARDPRAGTPSGGTVAPQAQAMATRRRISGGHALVVLAIWTAILPFAWVSIAPGVDPAEVDPALVVVHGLIVAVTAIPLVLARWGRAALRRASLVASLLLLAAGLADPQSRPQLTTVLVTAGVVVGVVVTVLFAGGFSRELLRFHAACQGGYLTERLLTHQQFRVHLDRPITDSYADPLVDKMRRLPRVEGVSYPYGQASTDPRSLGVSFREGISAADKARLGERLRSLPGVSQVQLCRY